MWIALASVLAAAFAVVITLRWSVVTQRKDDPEVHTGAHLHDLLAIHLDRIDRLDARMGALQADHVDVRAAVAHGIEDVERVNNRISATIRRTKAQLEEHGLESPALDAEAAQLRVVDGGGGDEGGLPPVQESVGEVQSSIPGVSAAELARVRGL
jgi:hypothetical protein